jgi:hypothetical protein
MPADSKTSNLQAASGGSSQPSQEDVMGFVSSLVGSIMGGLGQVTGATQTQDGTVLVSTDQGNTYVAEPSPTGGVDLYQLSPKMGLAFLVIAVVAVLVLRR